MSPVHFALVLPASFLFITEQVSMNACWPHSLLSMQEVCVCVGLLVCAQQSEWQSTHLFGQWFVKDFLKADLWQWYFSVIFTSKLALQINKWVSLEVVANRMNWCSLLCVEYIKICQRFLQTSQRQTLDHDMTEELYPKLAPCSLIHCLPHISACQPWGRHSLKGSLDKSEGSQDY